MSVDHASEVEEVRRAVLSVEGATSAAIREAAMTGGPLDAPLSTYVEKVRQHAYRVTDDDVEALRRSGLSDDAIYEVTVAAALGAGLVRLHAGLAALRAAGEVH